MELRNVGRTISAADEADRSRLRVDITHTVKLGRKVRWR